MDQSSCFRTATQALRNPPPMAQPPREAALGIVADIENIVNDTINLATRVADALGGPQNDLVGNSTKDAPADLAMRLSCLRSAVVVLNGELHRAANAIGI